jgi:hypothetical protein
MLLTGVAVLSLTIGAVQLTQAAAPDTRQNPAVGQQSTQENTTAQPGLVYAAQPPMGVGANGRVGGFGRPVPTHPAPQQSGNDFNVMEGGG